MSENIIGEASDQNSIFEKTVGETLHLLRKCAKVSQVELGTILSLHQSAISRIESGQQNLSPYELWLISQHFGVSIDDLIAGTVNYWAVAEKFGQRPPFPPRYREHPYSKVREVLPLLLFINKTKSHDYTNKLLTKLGLNNLLFVNPDQTIGSQVFLDLFHHSVETGILSRKNFSKLIEFTRADNVHGFLDRIYKVQTSSIGLLQTWALNSAHYESNFHYEIQHLDHDHFDLSVTPNKHMKILPYRDEKLGDLLCEYRKEFLTNFPRYIDQRPVKIVEDQCQYRGYEKCVYKIQAA